MGPNDVTSNPAKLPFQEKQPEVKEGPLHNIPDELLTYIYSLLDDKSAQVVTRLSTSDKALVIDAVRTRVRNSTIKDFQSLINEIALLEKGTKEPAEKDKLTKVINDLQPVGVHLPKMSDITSLVNLKSSVKDIRTKIIMDLLLDAKQLETLQNKVSVENPSPPFKNLFKSVILLQAASSIPVNNQNDQFDGNEFHQFEIALLAKLDPTQIRKFHGVEQYAMDILPDFEILPTKNRDLLLFVILEKLADLKEGSPYFFTILDKLPVSDFYDGSRIELFLMYGQNVENLDFDKAKEMIAKFNKEEHRNMFKSLLASNLVHRDRVKEAVQVLDSIPAEAEMTVTKENPESNYTVKLYDTGIYSCMDAALEKTKPDVFIQFYFLLPPGEVKDLIDKSIQETLERFVDKSIIKREGAFETLTRLFSNSDFRTHLHRGLEENVEERLEEVD